MNTTTDQSIAPASTYDLAALKAAYEADGVVKLPGLVSAEWVKRLTDTLNDFLKKDPGAGNSVNFGHGPGRTTVRWMWREQPEVLRFAKESGIAPTIAAVIGVRSLKFWYDNTFIQDGGYADQPLSGSPWHSDNSAFAFTGEQNPSVWVALTPVTLDTSPLSCLKGSHRTGTRYRPPVFVSQDEALPEGFSEQPDWRAAIDEGEWEVLAFEMEPGDTLLIHPDTIHGAPPAADDAPRRIGFTSRWIGDDIRWWKHAYGMPLPGLDFADVEDGTVPEGEFFPEVWRGE